MKSTCKFFVFVILYVLAWQSSAQNYIDYKPQYQEWNKNYIIDKIEYTDKRIIVYFRYVARIPEYNSLMGYKYYVTIFGKNHEKRWCLENAKNPNETFYIVDVKNISRNGQLINSSIAGYKYLEYRNVKPNEVITCEIHFNRLPKHIKYAHLLEGKNMKHDTNHFHAFNIKLKTENEDLGTFEDMVKRVHTFERRLTGMPRSNFVVPNKKTDKPKIVKKIEPQKPKAPLLQPPQKPEYPQESQARM